jgi:hypothetical protein
MGLCFNGTILYLAIFFHGHLARTKYEVSSANGRRKWQSLSASTVGNITETDNFTRHSYTQKNKLNKVTKVHFASLAMTLHDFTATLLSIAITPFR